MKKFVFLMIIAIYFALNVQAEPNQNDEKCLYVSAKGKNINDGFIEKIKVTVTMYAR